MSCELLMALTTRARPVADAPVDVLEAHADELAKRWALALLAARPVGEIGMLPLAEIAQHAPEACASVVRALRSDGALRELAEAPADSRSGERPPAPLAFLSVNDPQEAIAAVEALRGVLWQGLLGVLAASPGGPTSSRLVGDLGDRLAFVCAVVLARVLGGGVPAHGLLEPEWRTPVLVRRAVREHAPAPLPAEEQPPAVRSRAVLVDEHEEEPREQRRPRERANALADPLAQARAASGSSPAAGRALPWDTPLTPTDEGPDRFSAGGRAARDAGRGRS